MENMFTRPGNVLEDSEINKRFCVNHGNDLIGIVILTRISDRNTVKMFCFFPLLEICPCESS